jgi:hypothetical protein
LSPLVEDWPDDIRADYKARVRYQERYIGHTKADAENMVENLIREAYNSVEA